MTAVLSSMPIACTLESPARSRCSRLGPKITARLAAVILFPAEEAQQRVTVTGRQQVEEVLQVQELVCSSEG
ncbi:hypothetical protein EYF80_052367 [Liparis tanakae]|uniref:Uncharacterized protein n=1 Tax=Liparis tanakae TaxID=230148 RepID=A0A4Z2F8C2_9TELE|nr:hypothetical protein EYF80_052367 [Liparis tanakae]